MKKNLWSLEYSTEQNCYHVDLLEETLKKNLNACLLKNGNDYQIIYIGSQKDCNIMYKTLLKIKVED